MALQLLAEDDSERATQVLADVVLWAPSASDRGRAAEILSKRTDPKATKALASAAAIEASSDVRKAVGRALAGQRTALAVKALRLEASKENLPVVAGAFRFFLEPENAFEYKSLIARAYIGYGGDPDFKYLMERWGFPEFLAAIEAQRDDASRRAQEVLEALRRSRRVTRPSDEAANGRAKPDRR